MFGGFSAQKLKPQLKMAVSRFQIASNKKTALMKQQMREIAVMLAEEPPKEEKAKIRAEAIIREDNAVEAYEILQLECELLAERIKLLDVNKECPPDLVSCISTIMWATDRVDIPELSLVRKQFRSKYGKKFEEAALNNVGGVLNERVVSKLSVQPPAAYLVQTYLERICEQFEVSWKPRNPLTAAQMAEPMAAPVGYSVQVAPATGLGVVTGQIYNDVKVGYEPANASVVRPPPPVVTAAPYVPPMSQDQDFDEVDIYVPSIPSAPTGEPKTPKGGDDDSSDGGGALGSSYEDLRAKFEKLHK